MGRITEKNNVKIYILYLMRNINYPLSYLTLNEIVMQTDLVNYLDFDDAFYELIDLGLIEEVYKDEDDIKYYVVTRKGRMVAEELKSDLLPSILEKSLSMALRYLDFQRRGVDFDCVVTSRPLDQTFDVSLNITEHGKILLSTTLNVESEIQANRIKKNFFSHPEVIYHGSLSLAAGNVNYIYDKQKD